MKLKRPSILHFFFIVICLFHINLKNKFLIHFQYTECMSKHFSLLTELKTKLGNNFPTESIEDRILIVCVSLKVAGSFKVVRDRSVFIRWMDNMFEEFFKQGDMEKSLELPISKFMDRENTNKEKAFSNYLNVVCRPLFATYLILINDPEVSEQIFKDGID